MSTNRGMDKEAVVHVYNEILLSHETEQACAIWRDVDGPRDCHESEISQKEKNRYRIFIYIWNLEKMVQGDLFAKQE